MFIASIFAEENFAPSGKLQICYQTYGQKEDPAVLMVMGAMGQMILWPQELCQTLANEGYYVICFDHRDVGASSRVDYDAEPYDLSDMATDALNLLDHIGIEQAHLIGLSMGGPVAELFSVHFPNRVKTLTLMATSGDFRPCVFSLDDQMPEDVTLPPPSKEYLAWLGRFFLAPPKDKKELLEHMIVGWRLLNGDAAVDEQSCYVLLEQFLARAHSPENMLHHANAIINSLQLIQEIPFRVKVPTLIIHGDKDYLFPLEHGDGLAEAIVHASFLPVEGMGHMPHLEFYPKWIGAFRALTGS